MKQIVGANINGTITNNLGLIRSAVRCNTKIQWLDKQHMEMMSAFDLGKNWDDMAISPVLFLIDDEGNVHDSHTEKLE